MQHLIDDYNNDNISIETFNIKKDELNNDRQRVYNEIISNGGITCKELSQKWGCNPNDISGRFTELHKSGLIIVTGKKYLPNHKGRMYPHTVYQGVDILE